MALEAHDLEQISNIIMKPMSDLMESKLENVFKQIETLKICLDDRTDPDKNRTRWQSLLTIASIVLALIANFRPYINTAIVTHKPEVQIESKQKGGNQ